MSLVCLFLLLVSVLCSDCHGTATYGPQNTYPISDGHANSQFVSSTTNGVRYLVTVQNSGGAAATNFTLLHVFGTPYEMGVAQGQLMREEAQPMATGIWAYLVDQVETAILPYAPAWLAVLIADVGLDAALDMTYEVSRDYSGQWFYDELRGISDASGADYWTLVKIHMIAGLTQGHCSAFGAWGPATADGKLLQLRALDWNMDAVFIDLGQVTVYHPAPGYGHNFVTVGFTAFVGGLTGMNDQQLGISEIGIAYPDESFGQESRIGQPFIYVLRDILQWDSTLDEAMTRMANTKRTCDLFLGVGDGKLGQFRGFEYSSSVLIELAPENDAPNNASWHPRIPNTVYLGMDWICPGYNKVLSTQLLKNYGNLTAEQAITDVSAVEQSGDTHIAYYALEDNLMYLSLAARPGVAVSTPKAYANQFTRFNTTLLFNEPNPASTQRQQ